MAAFALLFVLSLLPRLLGLSEATTEDEDQWMSRTGGFAQAIQSGSWRGTYQVGHPGVTTMWLTDLGLGATWVRPRNLGPLRSERLVTQTADFLPALHAARVPFAVVNALLATACGALAARLFGFGPGLLGGLLLAFDPYWSAMSPIVGMDALLTGFMGTSLLSAILAFRGSRPSCGSTRTADFKSSFWAPASGLLAGLALLTKGSAVFLLPMPLVLAASAWWQAPRRRQALRPVSVKLALWCLGLLAAAAIWPAMWVDPIGTPQRSAEFVRSLGTSPHAPGNFFLGQPVSDPGPLFYPVALALHLGPATMLGLVALVLLRSSVPRVWHGRIGYLLDLVFIFALGLTLATKKVDRYILPLLPLLGLLAGLGWWMLLGRLAARLQRPLVLPCGLVLLSLLQAWPLVAAGRHPLASFNPLLGGIETAELAIPVGWGEGLDYVGDALKQQPNADQLVTGIWYPIYINFQAHAPGRVVNIDFRGPGEVSNVGAFEQADFYVDYMHARQRRLTPRSLIGREPDVVVTLNGAEYARVYRLKP